MWVNTDSAKVVNLAQAIWVGWETVDKHPGQAGEKQQALCARFSEEGKPVVLYRYSKEKGEEPSVKAILRQFTDVLEANGIKILEHATFNCMTG